MNITVWILLTMVVIGVSLMVLIQYKYIGAIKEKEKALNISQYEMYERMSFEEEQLHYNIQSNVITGAIAYALYKFINRKK